MALSSVIASVILGLQGTPADVPKNHWAFGAVDDLFKNGLLRGYPAESPLKLDSSAKFDKTWMESKKEKWKAAGYLVGYPDGLTHGRPDSRYEFAVGVHAMLWNITSLNHPREVGESSERYKARLASIPTSLSVYPDLARAISMLNPELTKLGADTNQMMARLNNFRWAYERPFKPLVLKKDLAFDKRLVLGWKKEWKDAGLLLGYPEGMVRDPSSLETKYELAVATYAAWEYSSESPTPTRMVGVPKLINCTDSIGKSISMLNSELTKLGADPSAMLTKLNEIRRSFGGYFFGG